MENLFSLFSHEFQYAMGWTVLHSFWQATLIAILSGVVMIVLRKKTAQTRYIVHNFALYGVLLAAVVTFSFYYNSNNTTKPAEPIAKKVTPAPNPLSACATDARFQRKRWQYGCGQSRWYMTLKLMAQSFNMLL